MKYVINFTVEVEEVLENSTQSLTLVVSFEMVAFQISSKKQSVRRARIFVPLYWSS